MTSKTSRSSSSRLHASLRLLLHVLLLSCCMLMLGCETPRPTLTDHQVDELLSLPAQVATASRELVQHDAQSREASLALYADLQAETARIGRQQDRLEAERKTLAAHRRLDPVLAVAIEQVGLLAACLLPLLVVAFLLWPRRPQPEHELVSDYLVNRLIEHHDLPRLEVKPKSENSS